MDSSILFILMFVFAIYYTIYALFGMNITLYYIIFNYVIVPVGVCIYIWLLYGWRTLQEEISLEPEITSSQIHIK